MWWPVFSTRDGSGITTWQPVVYLQGTLFLNSEIYQAEAPEYERDVMVPGHGKITDEGLAQLRSRVGTYNRPSRYGIGLYNEYASRDAIRHLVLGIGDPNPGIR